MTSSKIKFEMQEGNYAGTEYEFVSNNDYLSIDEACQAFLDFIDKATYCNPIELTIRGGSDGDVTLHNNPKV